MDKHTHPYKKQAYLGRTNKKKKMSTSSSYRRGKTKESVFGRKSLGICCLSSCCEEKITVKQTGIPEKLLSHR